MSDRKSDLLQNAQRCIAHLKNVGDTAVRAPAFNNMADVESYTVALAGIENALLELSKMVDNLQLPKLESK